eukprot:GEMP01088235.1.p1 GENE.GEMP01088235.1~~GEMP01088235.1.p1  ORF type:complete len:150 (+),score=28.57 GEMP01088235.1:61-510(+)
MRRSTILSPQQWRWRCYRSSRCKPLRRQQKYAFLSRFGAFYVFQNWAYGGVAAVIMVNVIILHYCYVCYLEEKRDYKPKTIVTVTATEEIRKAVKAQLGEDFRLKEGITLPGGATLSKGDLLRHIAPTSQDKALEAAELQFEQETRKDR